MTAEATETAPFRAKFGMPKPKIARVVVDLGLDLRQAELSAWHQVVPDTLPSAGIDDLHALSSDLRFGVETAEQWLREKRLSADADVQLGWAREWLDVAQSSVEHEIHARNGEDDGLRGAALRYLAEDLRVEALRSPDDRRTKAALAFGSWLLTGQLWHPKWDTAVERQMADYRHLLVAAMQQMLVPFTVEDPSPETFNRHYHEATGEWLFPMETVPRRTIRTADDAIASLAITFMLPWFNAHGWIADLKRAQRAKGGAFRGNPTVYTPTASRRIRRRSRGPAPLPRGPQHPQHPQTRITAMATARKPARRAKRANPKKRAARRNPRVGRKANGQFARKARANRTRKPARKAPRKARRASRSNPRYTLRRARRNPLVECSRPSKYVGAQMHWNGADWTIDGCDSTIYEKSGGPGMFSARKAGAKKRKPIAKRAVWEAAYRSRKSRSGAVKLPRRRSR